MKFLYIIAILLSMAWQQISPVSNKALTTPVGSSNLTLAPLPVAVASGKPQIEAKSALVVDLASGQILYGQNSQAKAPIASITKLISALVIIKNHDLNELVTVPKLPNYQPEDELLGLKSGQVFTVQALLQASLVASGNDAIDALALNDSGTVDKFATKMNQLASDWNIQNVHFSNASGLVDQNNFATAQALAKLASLALNNSFIAQTVATSHLSIQDQGGDSFNLVNTNQLLNQSTFSGIKTGYTLAAGQSLVGLVNLSGHGIITVVLNSPDRFAETQALASWVKENYRWL